MIRKITGVLLAVTLLTVVVIPSVQPANAQSVPIFLFKFGSFFTGDGQFIFTFGVTTNNEDDIIVVDFGNHRVQVFDSSGNFLFKFGSFGGGNGFLIGPQGVAVNSSDDIIVVDRNNSRIQVFDSAGN